MRSLKFEGKPGKLNKRATDLRIFAGEMDCPEESEKNKEKRIYMGFRNGSYTHGRRVKITEEQRWFKR